MWKIWFVGKDSNDDYTSLMWIDENIVYDLDVWGSEIEAIKVAKSVK